MNDFGPSSETDAGQLDEMQRSLEPEGWVERAVGSLAKEIGLSDALAPKPGRVEWGAYTPGAIGALFMNVAPDDPMASGNGSMNRVITNQGQSLRYSSSQRSITLRPRDRIWVPQGEAYLLEPIGLGIEVEVVLWPLPKGVPFSFRRG